MKTAKVKQGRTRHQQRGAYNQKPVAKRLSVAGSIVLAFDSLKEGKEGTTLTVLSTCSIIEISRPQDEKS